MRLKHLVLVTLLLNETSARTQSHRHRRGHHKGKPRASETHRRGRSVPQKHRREAKPAAAAAPQPQGYEQSLEQMVQNMLGAPGKPKAAVATKEPRKEETGEERCKDSGTRRNLVESLRKTFPEIVRRDPYDDWFQNTVFAPGSEEQLSTIRSCVFRQGSNYGGGRFVGQNIFGFGFLQNRPISPLAGLNPFEDFEGSGVGAPLEEGLAPAVEEAVTKGDISEARCRSLVRQQFLKVADQSLRVTSQGKVEATKISSTIGTCVKSTMLKEYLQKLEEAEARFTFGKRVISPKLALDLQQGHKKRGDNEIQQLQREYNKLSSAQLMRELNVKLWIPTKNEVARNRGQESLFQDLIQMDTTLSSAWTP